ncbi:MAG: DUF3800 domain-containing protein [Chloroflexi bacterium]|nr:DUF3800 domain-containing protein [Chloroflexota bacterium]
MSDLVLMQGVFDEAGDTGHSARSSRYLVVAGIVCSNLEPLRRVVTRTRKSLGKELREIPEIKAWHSPPKLIFQMLNRLAQLDIQIYAAILDKQAARVPDDPEDWYRATCAECVRLVLAQHSRVILTMDRRYTKASLWDKLANTIVNAQPVGSTLTFVNADSRNERALQAADVVAWSIFQKYAHEDDTYYRVIEDKQVGESVIGF